MYTCNYILAKQMERFTHHYSTLPSHMYKIINQTSGQSNILIDLSVYFQVRSKSYIHLYTHVQNPPDLVTLLPLVFWVFLFCFTLEGSSDCNRVFCSGSLLITLILCGWNERKWYQDRRASMVRGRVFPSTNQQFQCHSYILCSCAAFKCGAISRYQRDFLKASEGAQQITACSHHHLKYPDECRKRNQDKTHSGGGSNTFTIKLFIHPLIYSFIH